MTLQALIDQLQALAHEGHAQKEVCIDNCENGIVYSYDIYAHPIIDNGGCGKHRVFLSFGNKWWDWGEVRSGDEHKKQKAFYSRAKTYETLLSRFSL